MAFAAIGVGLNTLSQWGAALLLIGCAVLLAGPGRLDEGPAGDVT